MEATIAIILIILVSPVWIIISFLIMATSGRPILFRQKRMGKNKKIFIMYKFRTMVRNAERLQSNYQHLNEADGPVFKIYNDPRYTRVGKFLSHTGLDELPQLINIIKGEMAFVGPRPLPVEEAKNIPAKYNIRFSVLPGITSPWVAKGSHKLTFTEWMELDKALVKKGTHRSSFTVGVQSILLLIRLFSLEVKNIFRK